MLRGPGCFDMKAGLVMAFHALAALDDRDGVTLLVTGDEEIGSPSSRALIEEEARLASAALVLEASADGGALKTERKGVSLYDVRVLGRAAHAGLEPERGVNATLELAHQALVVAALADPAPGTTVTPDRRRAPARRPTRCRPRARSPSTSGSRTVAEQDRVDAAMRSLRPVLPGASLEVTGGPNRPPLEAAASAALFERARALAARLGLPGLDGRRGRRRVRRQLHGRRRHADAGRPRRRRRRRPRRRRARPGRRAARPHRAARRPRRGPAGRPDATPSRRRVRHRP